MSFARVIPMFLATLTAAAASLTAGNAVAAREAPAGQPQVTGERVGQVDRSIRSDPRALAAPSFSRIVIARDGRSTVEGRGTPGSQVIIHSDGRMIAAAIVAESGRWEVTLDHAFDEGDYRVSSAASRRTEVAYGDDVRIAVPKDFTGPAVIAYEAPPTGQLTDAASGGETARQRAQELAEAASRRFSEVMGGARERVQVAEAREKAPAIVAPAAPSSKDEGLVPRFTDWLERAAMEYQGQIIDKLSVPSGPAASPPAAARSEGRDLEPSADGSGTFVTTLREGMRSVLGWVQHWFERADGGGEREVARESEGSEGPAHATGKEERMAAENTRETDAAALKKLQEQRQADARKRMQENEKRIVEGLKKLEEARKAEDARKAAAGEKRESDEAAKRRSEEEALKQLQEQQKADAAKLRQENEKRIIEGLKKLDEAREAEETRKTIERKRIEDERAAAEKAAEDARKAGEAKRIAEEASRKSAERKRIEIERAAAEKAAEDARKAGEAKRIAEEASRKSAEAKRIEIERAAAVKAAEDARKSALAQQTEGAAPQSAQETPEQKPRNPEVAMQAQALGVSPREARSGTVDGAAAQEAKEPKQRVATVAGDARRAEPRSDAARSKGWRHRSSRREASASVCRGKAARGGRKPVLYRVRRGDTLWAIANRYLRSGARYEIVYRANRRQIRDPDVIFPHQCLVVPRHKGRHRG